MTLDLLANTEVASGVDLLSAWIESQMAYAGQPGLSIGIVYNQELIWSKGFGCADLEKRTPAQPDTIYRIASITKLFTSTAILQLRDAGKLQLDDPVTKHLDWFDIQNRYPDSPPITIRHLITHTSGLPREAAFPYWTDSKFPTSEQIRKTLPNQETALPTETNWKYSNLALSIAGEIVAVVSGQNYTDYIHEQILDPLGMTSTYVDSPAPDHPQLATGYSRRLPDGSREVSPFTDGKGITAAANMSTTIEDLAKFVMLQFRYGPAGERQILRGSTLREMQRVHWLDSDWRAGNGLGFAIRRYGRKTIIGHGGAVKGYRTGVYACVADKTGVVVLTNSDDGDPVKYLEAAFHWVTPAIEKAVRPHLDDKLVEASWRQYEGKYRSAWGDMQVIVLNGELAAIDPSQPDPTVEMISLVPVAERTFRIDSDMGGSPIGELAVFELDTGGKVQRVRMGENYLYPVEEW